MRSYAFRMTGDDLWNEDLLTRAHPDLALGALDAKMGVRVLEASAERVVATMPVATNTQAFGLLHGGAMAALAEAVGSWAAVIHAGPERTVVGVEISATHHRGAREGVVTATGLPLHRGGRVATYEVVIRDEQDRRLCTARMTSLIMERRPS